MAHSQGPWRIGRVGGEYGWVVCDEAIPRPGPHRDKDREYYGGDLVAESILTKNLSIIAEAPSMLNALKALIPILIDRALPETASFVRQVVARAEGRSDEGKKLLEEKGDGA